jgi:aspartokinase/homoserine dehydrogenase 1
MLLADRRIDLGLWRDALDASEVPVDFDVFERHVHADHLPHAAIIDCTADDAVAARYPGWLAKGIHVITPNKKAFSGSQADYQALQDNAREGGAHYLYETTVGAALPIIKTIRDLVDTGDRIHSVKGILSGTLAYLFNVYDGSTPFSEIVRDARERGFTEPDPRDDLSGMDVARKLTILARELGQTIEIGEFPVESLVPEALEDVSIDEFLDRLADYDDEIEARYKAAHDAGSQLRYVAYLNAAGEARVGLEAVAADHPFSNINLTDNIVQFETARYSANPLVVQGPGAGPAVTAGGVFADLLRLATYLSAGDGL